MGSPGLALPCKGYQRVGNPLSQNDPYMPPQGGQYGLIFLVKIPALTTLFSALISFGAYAWLRGPEFAAGLIVMLFVHEMGHVVEIRRQGMQASAPLFVPFLGA